MSISVLQAPEAVDLANCAREPIHIPGRIQPHGVLFALDDDLRITQVSRNALDVLGVAAETLLGQPVTDIVLVDDAARCGAWLAAVRDHEPAVTQLRTATLTFDAIAHRHDGVLILEFENGHAATSELQDYRRVRHAMARLQGTPTLEQFCQIAADEMRALTGFERVTVYRFDEAWNGHVFAESKLDSLPPLLGLHFPASDIPEQARKLYVVNRLRLIADAYAQPSPLEPSTNPLSGRPLDLSYAVLRSVSPVHIQYMKNMGAHASMSVSLMREGRLWGLLSCMNYSGPRYVPPGVRDACDFLGEVVSAQLAVKEDAEGYSHRDELQLIRERLMQRMSAEGDLVRGLLGEDLLKLTGAAGAAIVHGSSYAQIGETPTEEEVKALVAWLRVHAEGETFHTDSLVRLYSPAEAFKAVASGLVAISTTKVQGHYVLWFRPEVVQTVNWGGDPRKPVEGLGPAGLLSPRRSFELWQEVVKDRSLPWRSWEIQAAAMLREAIIAIVVRRAEELTRLNAELERSNSDLDAFAFVTSHDLKEPLRGISNYASFLLEDYEARLDEEGREKLRTLVRLSQRLEDIVESLLEYSRLGRVDLDVGTTDLNAVLQDVLELLEVRFARDNVKVRVERPLPVVRCDRTQAEVLLANLITNGIKYNDKSEKVIEIGYREPVDAASGQPVIFVRDNGIGIPERHRDAVFRMFKRLHGRDKFGGGTGAGLAFVKKIVDRHAGTIWIDSVVGQGSTVYFTLGV